MSSRAKRVVATAAISTFDWGVERPMVAPIQQEAAPVENQALRDAHLAALEREAFAKGFAQGEFAGNDAAGQRAEMMLHRLAQTLEELTQLRTQMIHQTERQMVQLALAIARRVVQREVSLDGDLLVAMARVALERLGETAQVKIRLNPGDYEAAGGARVAQLAGSNVMVLADAHVHRGGCRIESDMGIMDAGVDAQLQEIARALLGDDAESATPGHVVRAFEQAS